MEMEMQFKEGNPAKYSEQLELGRIKIAEDFMPGNI